MQRYIAALALLVPMCLANTTLLAQESALVPLDLTSTFVPDHEFDRLAAITSNTGDVRVIVTFPVTFVPEGMLQGQQVGMQHARIINARAVVKAALLGTRHEVVREYDSIPSIAFSLSSEALRALQRSGLAARIEEDTISFPLLSSAGPIVQSTQAAAARFAGQGRIVVVLDTGVDKDHAFIGSSQVSNEACFSSVSGLLTPSSYSG